MSGLIKTGHFDKQPFEDVQQRYKRGKVVLVVFFVIIIGVGVWLSTDEDFDGLLQAIALPVSIGFMLPIMVVFQLGRYVKKREASETLERDFV